MTCAEFRSRFPDYAAGRAPEAVAAALEAHLQDCDACEAVLAGESPALPGIRALPKSVEPAEDLWPEISERMARRRGGLRGKLALPRWGLAAAALLLVAVSSGITAVLTRSASSPVSEVSSGLEAEYAAASQDLSTALDHARDRLSPEAFATIERSLHIIDAAISESREALSRDPGNAALSQLVIGAWRQKLDLLRRATALAKPT